MQVIERQVTDSPRGKVFGTPIVDGVAVGNHRRVHENLAKSAPDLGNRFANAAITIHDALQAVEIPVDDAARSEREPLGDDVPPIAAEIADAGTGNGDAVAQDDDAKPGKPRKTKWGDLRKMIKEHPEFGKENPKPDYDELSKDYQKKYRRKGVECCNEATPSKVREVWANTRRDERQRK